MDDDVYEFTCGCRVSCLAEYEFRLWKSSHCKMHSDRSLPNAIFRCRMLLDAKTMRKNRLMAESSRALKQPRRSFAEMSAKGGFDL